MSEQWTERTGDSVYCRCGAQWHGRYVDSPYMPWHRQRHGAPIGEGEFRAMGFPVKKRRSDPKNLTDRQLAVAVTGQEPKL